MVTRKTLLSIFLFLSLILFFGLDLGRPFATPDEARYVEIPREMLINNDFITPKLNAMKYFEKPPFLYWMLAMGQKIAGLTEGGQRFVIAFFAFLGVMVWMGFLYRIQPDRRLAVLSSVVLTTTYLYYALSRLIIIDMVFTFWILVAFVLFYLAYHERTPHRRLFWYGLSFSLGMGVLTKGIAMLVLTLPAWVIWLICHQHYRTLRPFYPFTGALIFLSVTVPWHALAALKNPDFLYKYFYVEHVLRYTTTLHSRYQPIYFFIPILLIGFLPWTFFMIRGLLKQTYSALSLYFMVWAGWIFLFFSCSNSKLIPYILPLFAPLSYFAASALLYDQNKEKIGRLGGLFYSVLFLMAFVLSFTHPQFFKGCEEIIIPLRYFCSVGFVLSMIYSLIARYALFFHLIIFVLSVMFLNSQAIYIQKTSVKPLAQFIVQNKAPEDAIVSFSMYFQDLPVYTKTAPVVCVDAVNELRFGMDADPKRTKEWMLSKEEFIKKFKPGSKRNFWAIARQEDYKAFIQNVPDWNIQVMGIYRELILFYHKG